MPFSNSKDEEIARKVLQALQSEKYKQKSFLFLEPFDTSQTPGYLEMIGKPLDLHTVSNNLQDNLYDENTFWKDLSNVFNNAIKYHSDKPTKWIAQMATSMLKYMNKERKRAAETGGLVDPDERASIGATEFDVLSERKKIKSKLKIKLNSSLEEEEQNEIHVDGKNSSLNPVLVSSNPLLTTKKQSSMQIKSASSTSRYDESTSPSSEPPLKKPKLKLKLGSSIGSVLHEDVVKKISSDEKPTKESSVTTADEHESAKQPKLKLKLSLKSKTSTTSDSLEPISSSSDKLKLSKKDMKRGFSFEDDYEMKKDKKKKPLDTSVTPDAVASLSTSTPANDKDEEKKQQQNSYNSAKGSSSTTKLSVKSNQGNRGKELPKAVIASQQLEQTVSTTAAGSSSTVPLSAASHLSQQTTIGGAKPVKKKNKLTLKKSASNVSGVSSVGKKQASDHPAAGNLESAKRNLNMSTDKINVKASVASGSSGGTSETNAAYLNQKQCWKVLAGLRRRQQKNIKWFAVPITDKKILPDYNLKIKHPMDIQTVQSNLEKGLYDTDIPSFCLDVRRIFANALQFNTAMKDSLRPIAIEVLQTADDLLQVFLSSEKLGPQQQHSYQPLLYCWKLCIDVLNTIYKLENSSDGQPLALYFFHPVMYYCMGEVPPGYSEKVKKPMDFGTVTANLVEGRYQSVDSFASDCRLIIANCIAYHEGSEEGKVYVEQANKLNECLSQQLDQLLRYDKSSKGVSDRIKAKEPANFPKPPASLLSAILADLRKIPYTDKATKITQPCLVAFEEPISLTAFPDYMQHVREKMDLPTVEKKIKAGAYEMVEDFEYDVNLMFKNFEVYNSKRNAHHAVTMSKFASRKFRLLLMTRIRSFEDPTSAPSLSKTLDRQDSVTTQTQKESQPEKKKSSPLSSSSPSQKNAPNSKDFVAKKKAAPRISISAINAASIPPSAPSPGSVRGTKSPALLKMPTSSVVLPKLKAKPNQPVPLHIAIARVKEGFPLRRAAKTLQSWEADCARFFKELMRHSWISAARPKFIFHVPVPILFPDLSNTYAAKIKHPMDLTTIECSLLAGNKYSGPEDFVRDVALVFTNAIRFNKDGRDLGDPLSCAYYDASVHLLRYCRWLSLEILSDYVDDSDHTDIDEGDGLPPFSWSLTAGNRKRAREEMESLVLMEPIDISLEGDRWTWHEAECEKLLKALRHQSDLKYMTFFITPNYPHDYAAYISKPMDWEKVQKMLKKRQYRTFGDFIDDLRLIFSNALKYNAKHQGSDNVSGRAYEAAIYMSGKLESSINKMMLTVSDRLERERIDHTNAEREIEAVERAEEAHSAGATTKERDTSEGSASHDVASNISLKIRNVRKLTQQQNTDFEIPYFDEDDDGQHESSYFEVIKLQKSMFEKQRQDLLNMRKISKSVGLLVIGRHIEHQMATKWTAETTELMSEKARMKNSSEKGKSVSIETGGIGFREASAVRTELERDDRGRLQIKLNFRKTKKHLKDKLPMVEFD